MKKFLFASLIFLAASCGLSLTENENKAITEILDFYGGYCKYSIGVAASTEDEDGKGKYFEIELSESKAIDMYKERLEMITSSMAYRFFRNLNADEQENYSFIRGTILQANGEKLQHDYPMQQLKTVHQKMPVVENVVDLIKAKQFQRFKDLANPEDVFNYDPQLLVDGLTKYDSIFGNATGLEFYGFKFTNAGNTPVLSVFGMIMRDVQNNELRVWLNPSADNNQILNMDYKW